MGVDADVDDVVAAVAERQVFQLVGQRQVHQLSATADGRWRRRWGGGAG